MNFTWFKPAVFLLNRLRFPQKFALITFLFAMPLGLVIYFLCNNINDQVQMARLEIDGVEYLTPLQKLGEQLPQAMSLAHASLEKQAFAAEHLPTREAEIDGTMEQLAELDARLGDRLHTTQRFRVLRAAWEDLKDQFPKLTPDIADDQFRKMGQEVRDLMAFVGDESTLILDPDLDSYYFMDAVLLKLPASLDMVSEARYLVARQLQPGHELDAAEDAKLAMHSGLLNSNLVAARTRLRRRLRAQRQRHQPHRAGQPAFPARFRDPQPPARARQRHRQPLRAHERRAVPEHRVRLRGEHFASLGPQRHGTHQRAQFPQGRAPAAALPAHRHRVPGRAGGDLPVDRVLQIRHANGARDAGGRRTAWPRGKQDITVELQTRDELGAAARAFNSVATRLQQTGARFQRIFEGSLDGIFQTSLDGSYLAANPALAHIYGYDSPEELMTVCSRNRSARFTWTRIGAASSGSHRGERHRHGLRVPNLAQGRVGHLDHRKRPAHPRRKRQAAALRGHHPRHHRRETGARGTRSGGLPRRNRPTAPRRNFWRT